jgi:hypothetical protein
VDRRHPGRSMAAAHPWLRLVVLVCLHGLVQVHGKLGPAARSKRETALPSADHAFDMLRTTPSCTLRRAAGGSAAQVSSGGSVVPTWADAIGLEWRVQVLQGESLLGQWGVV